MYDELGLTNASTAVSHPLAPLNMNGCMYIQKNTIFISVLETSGVAHVVPYLINRSAKPLMAICVHACVKIFCLSSTSASHVWKC